VVQKHDEDYIRNAFSRKDQIGAEDAWKKIREQVNGGKDIQYSDIPKDIASALKEQSTDIDKAKYLKWMWYDQDSAQKIIDRLKSTGGEARQGDSVLIDAIKSIWSKSGSWSWNPSTSLTPVNNW
jgi:hypothetical protein